MNVALAPQISILEGYDLPPVIDGYTATYPYVAPIENTPFYTAPVPPQVYELPHQTPIIDSTNENSNGNLSPTYISGSLIDKSGKPIAGASMGFRYSTDSSDASGPDLVKAELLTGNSYTIEATYEEFKNYMAIFRAPGYLAITVPLEILETTPTVTMTKHTDQFPFWIIVVVVLAVYAYRKQTKKVGALSSGDLVPIFLLAGGVLAFDLIKRVLQSLGIWDSAETKKLDQEQANPNSPWSPNYWRDKPSNIPFTYTINQSTAEQYASEIYDSFGWIDDCEGCAKAVFRNLRTKSNLSFLAEVFQKKYSEDLLSFLRGGWWPKDRLSDDDVAEINALVSKLPNY